MARGTRVQPGWNGSQTTTDRGAPNNSSAITLKYTPFVNPLWVSERLFCFSGLSESVSFPHIGLAVALFRNAAGDGVESDAEAAMTVRVTACLLLCLTLSSWAQASVTVPVVDKSEPGSPLQISGNITFADQVAGNSVSSSSDYLLTARNVSGKGIVFMLVRFDESGPHGGGVLHNIQWDDFFSDDGIAPEDVFLLDRSPGGVIRSGCCTNSLDSGTDPLAEVRVVYAEFSDGSTYGEKREAKDILAVRSVIVKTLHHLDEATDDQTFLRLLAQKLKPDEVDGFFEAARRAQKSDGTRAARSLVHTKLANAEKHLAVMRTAPALRTPAPRRYEMSGIVIAVTPESKRISVYNDDIPGFMSPREMEYEIHDEVALPRFRVGDVIRATLLSDNEEVWVLENPVVTGHP